MNHYFLVRRQALIMAVGRPNKKWEVKMVTQPSSVSHVIFYIQEVMTLFDLVAAYTSKFQGCGKMVEP